MTQEIQEPMGNSNFQIHIPILIDSDEILLSQKAPVTIEVLGIELEEDAPFTKQDFEDALKKVSYPKKQSPLNKEKSET